MGIGGYLNILEEYKSDGSIYERFVVCILSHGLQLDCSPRNTCTSRAETRPKTPEGFIFDGMKKIKKKRPLLLRLKYV